MTEDIKIKATELKSGYTIYIDNKPRVIRDVNTNHQRLHLGTWSDRYVKVWLEDNGKDEYHTTEWYYRPEADVRVKAMDF